MTPLEDLPADEQVPILRARLARAQSALGAAEAALENRMRELFDANNALEQRKRELSEQLDIESRQLLNAQATGNMATIYGERGRPFTASAGAARILGFPEGTEVAVQDLIGTLHPLDSIRMVQAAQQFFTARDAGIDHVYEHRVLRHDTGEVRWLRWTLRRERAEGTRPAATFGTAQDITETRANARAVRALQLRAERRVRELDRLSSALAREQQRTASALDARTRFITEMAHEIRTPLNSLSGALELLADAVGADSPDFNVAREAADQLAVIAVRLLEQSDEEADALPPAQSAPQAPSEPAATADGPVLVSCNGSVPRILIAEDTASNRYVVERMVQQLGCIAHCVENGAAAVDAVRSGGFDAVLMDVMMPIMTGEEATQAIRALSGPEARTPIIGITAHSLQAERERLLSAGMTACLAKPVRRATLETALRTALLAGDGAVSLSARIDHELFQRAFLDLPPAYRERMRDAARQDIGTYASALFTAIDRSDDPEALRRAAHSLKGVALNIGALGVVEELTRYRELRDAGRSPSPDALRQEIAASLLAIDDLYRALVDHSQ